MFFLCFTRSYLTRRFSRKLFSGTIFFLNWTFFYLQLKENKAVDFFLEIVVVIIVALLFIFKIKINYFINKNLKQKTDQNIDAAHQETL